MNILLFLFVVIIAIVLFVLVFVASVVFRFWSVIRSMLGMKPKQNVYGNEQPRQSEGTQHISGGKPRTSTIDKNEGEYVDFEVIE